ncbi:MAG: acyl-CoA thioesterase [Rhodospirillales bacterium]
MSDNDIPRGELAIRTIAMPADTNPSGDIFGGWLLAQMDLAGGTTAWRKAHGRVATIAVDGMTFYRPVRVGDVLCCYADLIREGNTSLTYRIEAWVLRGPEGPDREKVTEGQFTFVAIDENGRPRQLPKK